MYQSHHYPQPAAAAPVSERAAFLVKTYLHLAGAILAFVALEVAAFQTPLPELAAATVFGTGGYTWLLVLLAFMGVSWIANMWAQNSTSPVLAYAGLGLYVVAEAVLFMPLLYMANTFFPGAIANAAVLTLGIFGALTAVVLLTRKDFSFLRNVLFFGSIGALIVIVVAVFAGFPLGVWFIGAMCLLAGGYILYYTSNVLHHYRTDQHVAAALALFASVALLFWYILQLFMSSRD